MATYRGSETILDYVNSGVPDGDHTFITTANSEEVSIDVEFVNITANTVYTESPILGNNIPDERMLIVKYHGDLTINAGVTLTPQVRKKGMFLYVKGHLTNDGIISMTARGAKAEGQNVYMFKNTDNSVCFVPAVGAPEMAGMRQANYTSSKTYAPQGNSGTGRQTGGGGTGAGRGATGGASAAGTSYSGGSGGGSGAYNINGLPAEPNGGKGGDARNGNLYTTGAGGGAGNPGGLGHGTYGNAGEEGTGGLLIVIADDVTNNGTIESNGSQGGNGYRAGGGGSGGGHVEIATVSPISLLGSVSVAGGRYGDGTRGAESGAGGSGGNGTFSQESVTLTINKYLFQDGEDIKSYIQQQEISNLIPLMTGNTAPSGIASASTEYVDGKWPPYKAFDRETVQSSWISQYPAGITEWLAYEFPNPVVIKSYVLKVLFSVESEQWTIGTAPKTWRFQGLSLSTGQWVDLDVKSDYPRQTWIDNQGVGTFPISNEEEYKKYRIFLEKYQYSGSTYYQIDSFEMLAETLGSNIWVAIGSAPVTKEMFDSHGITDLSIITKEAVQELVSDTPELLCWTDEDAPISSDALSESSNTETASGQIKEFIIHQDDYYNKIKSIAK